MILLNNVSTNTTSDEINCWGGSGVIVIRATSYGTAAVNIQIKSLNDPNARWATLTNGSFTADATIPVRYLATGLAIRATVTGATTGESNIYAEIVGL